MTNTKLNHLKLKRDGLGRFLPIYHKIAYFVYPSNSGPAFEKRKVKVIENNEKYIGGIDVNKDAYRLFLKHKMFWLEVRREKIKNNR